jgi:heme-degrading monooxygenase HmoA
MVVAVIYKWKVTKGKEKEFEKFWNESTLTIMKTYSSLGSSLHKDSQGNYVAYARWNKIEQWKKMTEEYESTEEIESFWLKHVKQLQDPIILQLINDKLKFN